MSSIRSILFYQYKKKTRRPHGRLSPSGHGTPQDAIPPEALRKNHSVATRLYQGRPVHYLDFQLAADMPCILYLHGGSFINGIRKKDWKLLTALLKGTRCPVVIPDYPLIPEHTCKNVLSYCLEVYEDLAAQCPHGVLLMGDSAGGSIAMAMAQLAVERGISMPSAILLLCPFLDATSGNRVKNVLASRDPVLDPEAGREAALLYAGSLPLEDSRVSPVYGFMKGLPRIYAWTGDNDILYADVLLLKEKLREAHIPYHIYVYPGMSHNWMYERLPEARTAVRQIIREIRNLTDFPRR